MVSRALVKQALLLALFTAWLVTLGGCALSDGQVQLDAAATKVTVRGGRGREVIVMPAKDSRSDRSRCGVKRNTYGVETANVYCSPRPDEWLGLLVVRGLHQAGFRVVTTKTKQGPDPLFLHLKLEHLFVDQVPGMWTVALIADAHVVVKAATLSGLSAERSFFVKGQNDVAGVLDSGIQVAMDAAAERLANAIVKAVVGLADRYPEVGTLEVAAAASRGEWVALAGLAP
jgi:hypothetical protein